MSIFVVTYSYNASPGALAALRPERYEYFSALETTGNLLASGQLLDGLLGDGMLLLEATNEAAAREMLDGDPFLREGYVARLDVAAWNPTTGTWVNPS